MFFSFAKIHLFFEMVIKTFLVSLFDQRDYIFMATSKNCFASDLRNTDFVDVAHARNS